MSAVISECGRYRYLLTREIDQFFVPSGTVTFIMLNPSTADAEQDDPTIRRCKRFAADWGFSRVQVVNLFAYRATDPQRLPRDVIAAEGPQNRQYLRIAAERSSRVVAAWGALPLARLTSQWAAGICLDLGRPLVCLGTNKDGSPKHPLYVRADAEVVPWPANDSHQGPVPALAGDPRLAPGADGGPA